MKNVLILTIVFFAMSCSTTSVSLQNISGNIENNSDYLGGANPPQEVLDNIAVYHPSENQTFYVRTGNVNVPFSPITTSFTTDSNGNYSTTLPPGIYTVISQLKYNYETTSPNAVTCDWLKNPDFVLIVTPTQTSYSNQYTIHLNYCEPLPN
jgi:hypothetical protein